MGWWTDTKNAGGRAWRYTKRHSAKLARESLNTAAGVAAGTACAVPPLTPLAPACAVGAALATDALIGERVERNARRAFDKSSAAADDFIDYLQGGKTAPRPPEMAVTVKGVAAQTRISGSALEEKGQGLGWIPAVGAAGLAVSLITVAVLRRTGHL